MNPHVEGNTARHLEKEENNLVFLKNLQQVKIKDFGISRLKQEISVKEFVRLQDKFKFDDPIQRNQNAWDDEKKSLLIHSIIMGIPVPNVFVQMVEGKYNVIDGKQRLTSLLSFLQNEFPLHKETPPVSITDENGEQYDYPIANTLFNALPEEFKDRIQAHTLVLEVLEMDDEIKNIVFARLNQTEPLKPIEKLRAVMSTDLIRFIAEMARSEFIQAVNISANRRNRLGDQEIVLQSMLFIAKNGDTGIGSDDVKHWITEGVSEDVLDACKYAIHYLSEVIQHIEDMKVKKALKKNHIPMLTLIASNAKDVTPEQFAEWMESFLVKRYDKLNYKDYARLGSAKKENASTRYRIMLRDFKKTFQLPE
jgi:Protein of unknown function DUF262